MLKESKMVATCRQLLPVVDDGSDWVLMEPCPAGLPKGTRTGALIIKHCPACAIKASLRNGEETSQEVIPEGQSVLVPVPTPAMDAEPAPVAAPAPEPVAAPVPAVVGELPSAPPPPAPVAQAPAPAAVAPPAPAVFDEAPVDPPAPIDLINKHTFNTDTPRPIEIDGVPLPEFLVPAEGNELAVDVEKVLRETPGYVGGPSVGGISVHALEAFGMCPRRFFYSYILGLRPDKPSKPRIFGTLYHDCMARRYGRGAQHTFDGLDAVAQAGAPKLAGEVRRLVHGQVLRHEREEWETWSVRAVEEQLTWWVKVKVGKKTLPVPVTGRIDIMLALRDVGGPHPPPGPAPQGVYLGDWKTSSYITFDLVQGYGMDFQFLSYNGIFMRGGHAERYGKLNGTMISVAGKSRKTPTADDFPRVYCPISISHQEHFVDSEMLPLIDRLCQPLFDDGARVTENTWPRNHTQCIGRWGACDYFDICDGRTLETVSGFHSEPHRILDPATFVEPPKAKVKSKAAAAAAAQPQPSGGNGHSKEEDQVQPDATLLMLALSLSNAIEMQPDVYAPLQRSIFLGPGGAPGGTMESTTKRLGEALRAFYAPWVEQGVKQEFDSKVLRFQKSGIAWEGGRCTWRQLASAICTQSWFDVAKVIG